MALLKDKTFDNGVVANYHRVTKCIEDVDNGLLRVEVKTYLSQVARNEGKVPVQAQTFEFDLTSHFPVSDEPRAFYATVYGALKGRAEFANAEDV